MTRQINRRSFLKAIPAGVALTTFSCKSSKNDFELDVQSTGDPLYDNFRSPQSAAKPFFRWWWNDNRVTEKEVRRELRYMAANGAGGVEINPIALPEIYDDLPGEKLTWLSREWNEALIAAVDEAHKNEMIVDLIVGTGWPFGGNFLSDDETVQGVKVIIKPLQGPVSLQEKIDIPDDPDHKLMQVRLFPQDIGSIDDGIDLTYHVDDDHVLRVDIPRGDWNIYIVTWRNKFRNVMGGVQGGDGPVLDHFNKQAVRKYLERMSDRLNPLFGGAMGNGIRAMFCDSIELEGANWTGDMEDEFRMRNGYDIEPYLPLLLAKETAVDDEFADRLRRVRYDFSKTLADLFMERFILVYHDWCLQNGVVSRYQAYGYPWLYTDLLDGYLVPDIPESDQWLFNGGWVREHRIDDIRYAIWNKYASSGGHLTGKKIVSCEAMTNTRGVFEATLQYIKQATDIDIVSGINHLVLHGYNYSPPEAVFPGWIRFGAYFGEHNTWAPYFKLWADYAARLCQIFQDSQYVANVAILGPTPDVWREHGLDRNPWTTTPAYLHDFWQSLNHHGYCSDYINSTILRDAEFRDGKLVYGPMRYDIVICADVHSLEKEAAQALFNFAENGGRILFINEVPGRSPGLTGQEKNDLIVSEMMTALLEENSQTVRSAKLRGNLTAWIGKQMRECAIEPAVRISNADERLFMIHHTQDDRDIFFFCNSDRQRTIDFNAGFALPDKTPWLWDAETGGKFVYAQADEMLHITLQPLQSMLLVFDDQSNGKLWQEPAADEKTALPIDGPWEVEFQPVKGKSFTRLMPKLQDFREINALQDFSGTAVYRTSFLLKKADTMILDLGDVFDIAEVTLNGRALGARWWGKKQFVVEKELRNGSNNIEIKVTTTLFNYVASLKGDAVADYWLARRKNKGLVSAGLVGPVRLCRIKEE